MIAAESDLDEVVDLTHRVALNRLADRCARLFDGCSWDLTESVGNKKVSGCRPRKVAFSCWIDI